MSGELVTRQGETIRKGRVSPALRSAIVLIVTEGLSIVDAAQRVGMKPHSLQVALKKGHVKACRADVKRAWLASQTDKAWKIVGELMDGAASEKVQLEAAKTVLQAAGELTGHEGDDTSKARQLINLTQNVTHFHGAHPLTERLPGVVEVVSVQDLDDEALDP